MFSGHKLILNLFLKITKSSTYYSLLLVLQYDLQTDQPSKIYTGCSLFWRIFINFSRLLLLYSRYTTKITPFPLLKYLAWQRSRQHIAIDLKAVRHQFVKYLQFLDFTALFVFLENKFLSKFSSERKKCQLIANHLTLYLQSLDLKSQKYFYVYL